MDNIKEQMHVVYGDGTLGLNGLNYRYIFSYEAGGLESMLIDGKEWVYRTPRPLFWRATTDNDRGNHFSEKSAVWYSADMFSTCQKIKVAVNGHPIELPVAPVNNQYTSDEVSNDVDICFTFVTATSPQTTVDMNYHVEHDGEIKLTAYYHGNDQLPELPVFGIRMVMPTVATGFDYCGLSGETYPDRMAGAQQGQFHVDGLPVTKYLIPQDCGVHMNTESLLVNRQTTLNNADTDDNEFSLKIHQSAQPFAFSCLPYTSEELESATHQEELPVPRRTVLSVMGAIRGVGGIDSWGADVKPPYHISAGEDIEFSIVLNAQS